MKVNYEALEQLTHLRCLGNLLTLDEIEGNSIKMKKIIAAVQDTWTAAILSGGSQVMLQNFFSYQALFISKLLESGHNMANCPNEKHCSSMLHQHKLYALLDSLFEFFGKYVDQTSDIGVAYRLHYCKTFRMEIVMLVDKISNSRISRKLKCFLAKYLADMISEKIFPCTWCQLSYFQSFVIKMSPLIGLESDREFEDIVFENILELEFNQFELFVCQQERIRSTFSGKEKHIKAELIKAYINRMEFKARGEVARYDQRWPPLSVMLLDWLKIEEKALEPIPVKELKPVAANNFRLQLQLSVSHLGLLIRLLAKESLFGSIPLTELFEFFTSNFSTKRKDIFSSHNLSKEYYSKNQVTAAEIKDLLSKMISRINLEYFPVVAAISAIAFYR